MMNKSFLQILKENKKFNMEEYERFIESEKFKKHHEKAVADLLIQMKADSIKSKILVITGVSSNSKIYLSFFISHHIKSNIYSFDSDILLKYIGETEKNILEIKSIEKAKGILFFDEADALFGKSTNLKAAHDKYANQEVSYIKNRLLEFKGLRIHCLPNKRTIKNLTNNSLTSVYHLKV